MVVVTTPRLLLRRLEDRDAGFLVELLNDPAFIRFIADRGVRTEQDAREYLSNGPYASYARYGFGLCCVCLRDSGVPIGICGFLKRAELDDADIGFALLPRYCARGYAFEVASALLRDARALFALTRVLAITNPDNASSIKLLDRLGFSCDKRISVPWSSQELLLFSCAV